MFKVIELYHKKNDYLKELETMAIKSKTLRGLLSRIKKHTDIDYLIHNDKQIIFYADTLNKLCSNFILTINKDDILDENGKLIVHFLCDIINKEIEYNYIEIQKIQYDIEHENELIEKYNSLVLQLNDVKIQLNKDFIARHAGKFRVFKG